MYVNHKLRLRQSVGIVQSNDGIVDFFKANVRQRLVLRTRFSSVAQLLSLFNGARSIEEVSTLFDGDIDVQQLNSLASFLKREFVLIEQDVAYPVAILEKRFRLVNLLEDYFHSTGEVLKAIDDLRHKTVVIIGMGAVGSFIATYLAKTGVGKLILVDNDSVEISNLHRQYFFEDNIRKNKASALKVEIKNINPEIAVNIISDRLDIGFFKRNNLPDHLDLIVNCADEPSVDQTSRIVAEYSMNESIPHIIGGGYNLHFTLIGQTIIPYKTACFKCFEVALSKINSKDLKGVKKLHRENRKLGSFSPLSGLAANLAALDAFKVLIDKTDTLQQTNRRIDFNLNTHNFNVINIERNPNCEWCGG